MNKRIRAKRLKRILYNLTTMDTLILIKSVRACRTWFLPAEYDFLMPKLEALYQLNQECIFTRFDNDKVLLDYNEKKRFKPNVKKQKAVTPKA